MKLIYLILPFIILTSCSREAKEFTHNLEMQFDLLELPGAPNINPVSNRLLHLDHLNHNILAFVNQYNHVLFYDLDNENLYHEIQFETDGPNSIRAIFGIHTTCLDTIYIIQNNLCQLAVSDSTGTIFKRIDICAEGQREPILPMVSSIPVIEIDNTLYFGKWIHGIAEEDKTSKIAVSVAYNKSTNTTFDTHYFPIYQNELGNSDEAYIYSRIESSGKWVYSYLFSNYLYAFDEQGECKVIDGKSKFAKKKIPLPQDLYNEREAMIESLKPRYLSILYDKWNKLFYRIYQHETKITRNHSDEDIIAYLESAKQFSVIIFNNNLEKIGETLLPEYSFNPEMRFVTEQGLFFGLHENHPEFDPDYLKFARFSVEPIK